MDAPEVSVDLSVALYHRTASPDPRGAAPARSKLNAGAKTQRIEPHDRKRQAMKMAGKAVSRPLTTMLEALNTLCLRTHH